MKTANKQIEIVLPKIQELTLLGTPAPRKLRRWNARLRATMALAGWLLRAPEIHRTLAPDAPLEPEHAWRNRGREWIA
jgi:hypothetical protein